MPFLLGNLHFHTTAVGLLLAIGRSETCHAGFVLVSRKHKVEWCDVARHGDIAIIGEDGWQTLGFFG